MDGSGNNILNAYGRVLGDDNALFWSLQLFGWTGISLLTYLSLSVPYDQYELAYLAHNISQSVVGLVLSIPLRPIFAPSGIGHSCPEWWLCWALRFWLLWLGRPSGSPCLC